MQRALLLLALALVAPAPLVPSPIALAANYNADQQLAFAFKNHRSGFVIEGQGTILRLLPDDTQGARHQKFLLRLTSGQVLLFAHNIDLARRVPGLQPGRPLAFRGQYEWNAKGGVIHWTHRDPSNRHSPGWLKYAGVVYQ